MVFLADVAVTLLASVATAVLALVVADLLPKDNADGSVVPLRWAAGFGVLVLLWVALWWRTLTKRKRGTLFYVQMLDESMENWQKPLDEARRRHMAMRSVVRWADLGLCTRDGVIDVVEPCKEVGAALEEAINRERDDTGYTVAPNMLWPMELAVGAYLPHADDLQLLELRQKAKGNKFSLLNSRQSCIASVQEDLTNGEPQGRVGVWLNFTDASKPVPVDDFRKFGACTLHKITRWDKKPGEKLSGKDMVLMGSEIAEHLERIKKSAGERELVVIAMAPKAVMLAAGWHLSQRRCRFFRNTHLMHYDESSKTYLPMRVREAQPATPPEP